MTLPKSGLENLAHCATNRAILHILRTNPEQAMRECLTAEMYHTMADRSNPSFPS
jgi:hypothetical protein